jgi:hypothetical protein
MVDASEGKFLRVDDPRDLPAADALDLVLVDWAYRQDAWSSLLQAWPVAAPRTKHPKLILFGPHTDLRAHADAREAGLGPMWARSRLLSGLADLLR